MIAGTGIILCALMAVSARAGPADAPPEPVLEITLQDWTLSCDGDCEISTGIAAADNAGAIVLELRVSGPAASRLFSINTSLPLYLPDGVEISFGDSESRPVVWRTCNAQGCEARVELEPDLLAALRRERAGSATLTLENGVRVRLAVSLMGFSAAFRALQANAP
jgi:invasion protein IalB